VKIVLRIVGPLFIAVGLFWFARGTGLLPWPHNIAMVDYGAGVAASGIGLAFRLARQIIVASLCAARASGRSMLCSLEWSPWRIWKPKLGMLRSYWPHNNITQRMAVCSLGCRLPPETGTAVFIGGRLESRNVPMS
jgi:hypothetical protein